VTDFPQKVLVIGLDGATFDLIEPWAAAGLLPNLSRLMAEGSHGQLLSTLQPVTAPAWTTFMTGVNQGKHGLYDFIRRRADSYELEITSAAQIALPNLFELASQQGRRVISVNVPYTFPPRAVNGICLAGPFAPAFAPELVYPAEIFPRLHEAAPGYFVLPDYDARQPDPLGNYAHRLLQEIDVRQQMCLYLMQTEPWDLFATVFMATDEAQHAFWHCQSALEGTPQARYRKVIQDIYRRADQALGVLLEASGAAEGKATVIILSDHGAGALHWMINLNRWLSEAGFLQFHKTNANSLSKLRARTIKWLANAYKRYLPSSLRATVRSRLGAAQFNQVKGDVESALFTTTVDWANTRAYALGAGGNLFINLQGREPQGIIQPGGDYERLRSDLIAALRMLSDPETGAPLVKNVYRKEELYRGPQVDKAPDLIIQWQDYSNWGRGRYDSLAPVFEDQNRMEFTDLPLTGSHRPEGILIAWGPGVLPGQSVTGARLVDLAPTILGLLGINPPDYMDGQRLDALFTSERRTLFPSPSSQEVGPISGTGHDYTPEEAEQITEHLRSLGYL
jgi:predicted AlkP superfamily phosphohydrolase/phosphomutase